MIKNESSGQMKVFSVILIIISTTENRTLKKDIEYLSLVVGPAIQRCGWQSS